MTTKEEINAFYEGLREGVYMYAYMKDGTYYVGTTGKTLVKAYAEIEAERQQSLFNEGFDDEPSL
jgi:predicted transcriptional regulator